MDTNFLYTPQQASEYLNISRSSLYVLLKENKLRSVRIGRSRRILLTDLTRFVETLDAA
jgi:excisionase family DNA binding protein